MFCSIMAGTNEKREQGMSFIRQSDFERKSDDFPTDETAMSLTCCCSSAFLIDLAPGGLLCCLAALLALLLCYLAGGCPACPAALLLPCLAGCSACPAPLLHCCLAGHLNPVCQHTIHIRCCTNRHIGHVAQCAVCTVFSCRASELGHILIC